MRLLRTIYREATMRMRIRLQLSVISARNPQRSGYLSTRTRPRPPQQTMNTLRRGETQSKTGSYHHRGSATGVSTHPDSSEAPSGVRSSVSSASELFSSSCISNYPSPCRSLTIRSFRSRSRPTMGFGSSSAAPF